MCIYICAKKGVKKFKYLQIISLLLDIFILKLNGLEAIVLLFLFVLQGNDHENAKQRFVPFFKIRNANMFAWKRQTHPHIGKRWIDTFFETVKSTSHLSNPLVKPLKICPIRKTKSVDSFLPTSHYDKCERNNAPRKNV